jgi:hypothetical protein
MAWHREMMGWKNLVTKIFVKEKGTGGDGSIKIERQFPTK